MLRNRIKCFAVALTCAIAPVTFAQTYPSSPITVVSPFPAGGATDTLTRVVAERMGKELGQSMIVENKAGAGTSIGASYVSREKPDGYTILMATNSTLVTNRYLYKELPYDPDGFAPIGMVGIGPLVLLASPKTPFSTTKDAVQYLTAHPGKASFASFGPGTSSHLAGEYFKQVAKLDMLHVPFKGATQALPVLVQGDVDLFFDMVATGMPQANAGKVKVLGITSKSRMNILPDVPTIAEQGYPGFEMTAWFSFVAPRGTPEPVLEKLRSALAVALKDDKVRASMGTMGIEPRQGTAQELISQIRSEQPVIEQLVQRANVQVQ